MATTKLIGLMVDTIQKHTETDIAAFQPSEEETRFVLSTEKNSILVDADRKVFVPMEKEDPAEYMEVKKFLKEVGLEFRSPTLYKT